MGALLAALVALLALVPAGAAAAPAPPAPVPAARAVAASVDAAATVVPGSFVVRTDGPVDPATRAELAQAVGGSAGAVVSDDTFVVEVPGHVAAPASALGRLDEVVAVQPEQVYRAAAVDPDDPCWRSGACAGPGHAGSPGQLELRAVGAPEAWAMSRGSEDVVVAVLDTLIEQAPPHRDLAGKLLPGASFLTDRRCTGDTSARDHGTIAAGIIAAQPGNGLDMAGLGWGTRVLPVEVLNDCGAGTTSTVALGIRWAADQGADIINLSLTGSQLDPVVSEAVDHAQERGALVVAAAGNGSPGTDAPVWPAADEGVVAVAATGAPGTDGGDLLERYSNFGPWVDIAAPGTDVLGLRRVGGSTGPLDGTTTATGTSFATPMVSAAAALVLAQDPSRTGEQVAARLARSAAPIAGSGPLFGWGRLDVAAALRPLPVGYRLVAADGGVFTFGAAAFAGAAVGRAPSGIAGAAGHLSGRGYWLAGPEGRVHAFGAAPHLGDAAPPKGSGPVVAMAATPGGDGYWLATRDGRVLAEGAATPAGTLPLAALAHPAVGVAAAGRVDGGWVAATDGGVFAFGGAGFFGSTGAMRLNRPIVGVAGTPSGGGYWLVASDGGVFAFGDAPFFGSTGALRLNRPIVGMAPTATGRGYWLVASDGGVFAFGDAAFVGSTGAVALNRPVVALAVP